MVGLEQDFLKQQLREQILRNRGRWFVPFALEVFLGLALCLTCIFGMDIFLSIHGARAESPRYRLSIKRGEELPRFLQTNRWMQDFQQTNLYEGLMIKMGPLMGSLADSKRQAWKGRLVEAFAEMALQGSSVHIYHFHHSKLVQPLGLGIQNLGAISVRALSLVLEALRSHENQSVDSEERTHQVIPIFLAQQKLAVVLAKNCLAVSRDPQVAVWSWEQCEGELPLSTDARVGVSLASLAAGTEKALTQFLGLGTEITFDLSREEDGLLKIVGGIIPLNDPHRIINGELFEDRLKALPASTQLMLTLALPAPKELTPVAIKNLMSAKVSDVQKGEYLSATYFHLGSSRLPTGGVEASTGILIGRGTAHLGIEQWVKAFEPNFGREIFVKAVCENTLTLVTPYSSVVEEVEKSCSGQIPTLKQLPAELRAPLSEVAGAQAVVNLGQALSHMVDLGWQLDMADREVPNEVKEAKKILKRLPAFVFSGKVGRENIQFHGQYGVF